MKNLRIRERKDGSATLTVDLDQKERQVFFLEGIREDVEKAGFAAKVKVLAPENAKALTKKGVKTIEMSDEEYEDAVRRGMLRALRQYLEGLKAPPRKKAKR